MPVPAAEWWPAMVMDSWQWLSGKMKRRQQVAGAWQPVVVIDMALFSFYPGIPMVMAFRDIRVKGGSPAFELFIIRAMKISDFVFFLITVNHAVYGTLDCKERHVGMGKEKRCHENGEHIVGDCR